MKSEESWAPTKFVKKNGRLKASRNPDEVGVGSRLIADLVARFYDEAIRVHAAGKLIDLGCGKVPLYASYREFVSEVTCVDWSEPAAGHSHLDMVCDLSQRLPLNDDAYDTVILSDVLEHIPDPELLWSELSRITKPGGKLLLNTPFLHCLHEQPHDYYRFTTHALSRYAERSGFDVITLQAIGGTPEVVADIFAKHLQFVPIVGRALASALQTVTRWLVSVRPGSTVSARTADAFPLGYAMVAIRSDDLAS